MSVAALIAAWWERSGGLPAQTRTIGEASTGAAVTVELYLNGSWVDISSYVLVRDGSGNVSITRGQSGEGSTVDHGVCVFQLDNRDGRFSPRNPVSPYYGYLRRNTPVRVSVPVNTGRNYRFQGEISVMTPRWDTTGSDVWVDVEATGVLRRLRQSSPPGRSKIRKAVSALSVSPVVYWPCEDVEGSTKILASATGKPSMLFTGTPSVASFSGFRASDPLPVLDDATLVGGVTKYPDPDQTQVRFFLFMPPDGTSNGKVVCTVNQDNASEKYFELFYESASGRLKLRVLDGDGATLALNSGNTSFGPEKDIRGKYLRVSIELDESGANLAMDVRLLELRNMEETSASDQLNVAFLSRVVSISMCPAQVLGAATRGISGCAVGHVTLQSQITALTDLGDAIDRQGERAGDRFARVCSEAGIAYDYIGALSDTTAMGGEDKLAPHSLVTECAEADLGILYETTDVLGLGYRTRKSLYNQNPALTLVYANSEMSSVPLPVEDDQRIHNQIAVTRTTGGTSTAEDTTSVLSVKNPPAGVGIYTDSPVINVELDDDLPDQAYWRLRLGTVDEARFPQISFDLSRTEITSGASTRAAILAMRLGDVITIADPPSWLPPDDISQMVLGFTETINQFQHLITVNCAPYSPYRIGTLQDPVYSRLDTAGSELTNDVSAAATSVSVTTTDGPAWTTSHQDTPFDLLASGEVMRVVSLGSTITSNSLLISDASGWNASNSTITYDTTTVNAAYEATASIKVVPNGVSASGGVNSDKSANGTITAGNSYTVVGWVYSVHGWADLRTAVDWYTAADVFISSSLGSATSVTEGTWTFLSQTFTAPALADHAVTRGRFGSTPAAGDTTYWWAVRLISDAEVSGSSPQTMTVVRSINGITKAQLLGTDIALASPTYIAL